ncbi:unnamed protein product [Arabis nemorensis]|uniref:Uncharacterized protein n=1 Tax=Arabis nemorensis TaxID=586526 RepID=A0A565CB64_9BRAS|nr:unnamed protein product [Arabis nemorensis]
MLRGLINSKMVMICEGPPSVGQAARTSPPKGSLLPSGRSRVLHSLAIASVRSFDIWVWRGYIYLGSLHPLLSIFISPVLLVARKVNNSIVRLAKVSAISRVFLLWTVKEPEKLVMFYVTQLERGSL